MKFTVHIDAPNCTDPSILADILTTAIHTENNLSSDTYLVRAKVFLVRMDTSEPEPKPKPVPARISYFYSYEFHNIAGNINKFCYGTCDADVDTKIGDILDDIKAEHLKEFPDTTFKLVSFNKI